MRHSAYNTLSIKDTQHDKNCDYAEFLILFIAMLNVIMLSDVMLSVVMLSVVATFYDHKSFIRWSL
jgi:hypothetical protein